MATSECLGARSLSPLPFANMSNPAFCFRTFLARCVDREPVVVLSCVLGGLGLGMPVIVPPMRRAMGLDAHQVSACERSKLLRFARAMSDKIYFHMF